MADVIEQFKQLLETTLVPQYCEHPTMGMQPQGFKNDLAKLSRSDITLFLQAWDTEIIQYVGSGKYRLAQANATEKFFWEGSKTPGVRSFALWAEPIITVGVLARLHFEMGWPINLIGSQSKGDWAYDAVAYKHTDTLNDYILCEVKKTPREIDHLAEYMHEYLAIPPFTESDIKGPRLNAYRKVKALRARRPSYLWLAGPDRYDIAYRVIYNGSLATIDPTPLSSLAYHPD